MRPQIPTVGREAVQVMTPHHRGIRGNGVVERSD